MPRGTITVNGEICKGCELCVEACPHGLIALGAEVNFKGYHVAILIESERCTGCSLCAVICPDVAIQVYRN